MIGVNHRAVLGCALRLWKVLDPVVFREEVSQTETLQFNRHDRYDDPNAHSNLARWLRFGSEAHVREVV